MSRMLTHCWTVLVSKVFTFVGIEYSVLCFGLYLHLPAMHFLVSPPTISSYFTMETSHLAHITFSIRLYIKLTIHIYLH